MKRIKNKFKILSVFTNPNQFVDTLNRKKGLCVKELLVVILLTFMRTYFIVGQVDQWFLVKIILSIALVTILQHFIYLLGRGKSKWKLVFNLSIYFHLLALVAHFFEKIPIIWILVVWSTHLLIIYYQYVIGKYMIRVNEKFINTVCSMEFIGITIFVSYQLLICLGRWVVYDTHIWFLIE